MVPENEYNPYYKPYIHDLASSGKSITQVLIESQKEVNAVLATLPEDKELYRYAEGKWTIKELLQHAIDTERIFNYRALRFARNDKTSLQGFEQDDYNDVSNANDRNFKEILSEFNAVRMSTILMYQSFSEEALTRIGTASGSPMSVRALGYLSAGHVNHHLRVFQERYL
ncbi:DinB family protein [Pseudotenacibaculum haliotis]|uniref:DinB family protein n=1 Tax=Pseudotenacibaculum haliotis TaxID=1862138 RepID=A0ABW5LTU0_9FLAO